LIYLLCGECAVLLCLLFVVFYERLQEHAAALGLSFVVSDPLPPVSLSALGIRCLGHLPILPLDSLSVGLYLLFVHCLGTLDNQVLDLLIASVTCGLSTPTGVPDSVPFAAASIMSPSTYSGKASLLGFSRRREVVPVPGQVCQQVIGRAMGMADT
jgi:hypothetical protein